MIKKPTSENSLTTEDKSLANTSSKGGDKPNKILVVEDEFLISLNIKECLTEAGYEVPAIARSGEVAIRMATEIPLDLILMDIRLDGPMSGIEAAAEIRKAHPIPIIYLTTYADVDMVNKAKITEPFGYLPKPFDVTTLICMIEVVLNKNTIDTEKQRLEQQKVQEANAAITGLLRHRELERKELEQHIQTNVSKLIVPTLNLLERSNLTESQKLLTEAVKINLQQLTEAHVSPSGKKIAHLSATEIQVANFVKAGKSTKEIAKFLGIASSTVNTHRDSIRKKLGIKNLKKNLQEELEQIL